MALPAYLQGTQTGGLLQNLQQNPAGLQSSIPGVGGQNYYVPGAGMAPYAPQGTALQSSIPSAPQMGGLQGAGVASQSKTINGVNYNFDKYGHVVMPSGSTFSSVPSVPQMGNDATSGAAALSGGQNGYTTIGQPSNTFDNGAYQAGLTAPAGGGGAGGSSKDAAGNPLPMGQPTAGNNAPQINSANGQYPNNGAISYQSPPQGGNPTGYAPPGGNLPQDGSGALQMQQQSPQDALNGYMNTPGYQLLMTNQQNQFQQSPGYQYAVNQALQNVQNNASARGLLESGSVLRDMTDRAQGMASQGYNDWWNKQNSAFTDYQNRLAGLAGGNVGGDQAMALGQNLGQNSAQMGSDMASLFGNQGAAGFGGMTNTGAAQSNNVSNAGAQQLGINSANASTQLAGAVYNRGLF